MDTATRKKTYGIISSSIINTIDNREDVLVYFIYLQYVIIQAAILQGQSPAKAINFLLAAYETKGCSLQPTALETELQPFLQHNSDIITGIMAEINMPKDAGSDWYDRWSRHCTEVCERFGATATLVELLDITCESLDIEAETSCILLHALRDLHATST